MSSFKRAGSGTTNRTSSSSTQKQRRGVVGRKIPKGTTPSLANGQLLTSSGIKSLDYLLKGGLAIGTTLLIETGQRSSYADVLLKYFLSEGVCQDHYITLLSADVNPTDYLRSCPKTIDTINLPQNAKIAPSTSTSSSSRQQEEQDEDMTIAWRYKNLPKINTELGSGSKTTFSKKYQHTFTLKQSIKEEDLVGDNVHVVDLQPKFVRDDERDVFEDAITAILEAVTPFIAEPKPGPLMSVTVHRIAIHNIGSAAWWSRPLSHKEKTQDVARFLMQLRGIARRACCVFCISLVDSIGNSEEVRKQLHMLSDICLRMDGFGGTKHENSPILKEYHGFFRVLHLNTLNSIVPLTLDVNDLAFKLKSTGLVIEKLHLPPELSETANRAQEDGDTNSKNKKNGKNNPKTKKKMISAAEAVKEF
eukprot:m.169017 g.169017  ORF g.169017 m.169017 type:complete len:419 (+) comp13471_c3_seq1:29-1285(+)